jgi:hypothetical protein
MKEFVKQKFNELTSTILTGDTTLDPVATHEFLLMSFKHYTDKPKRHISPSPNATTNLNSGEVQPANGPIQQGPIQQRHPPLEYDQCQYAGLAPSLRPPPGTVPESAFGRGVSEKLLI